MSNNYYDTLLNSQLRTEELMREANQRRKVSEARRTSPKSKTQNNQNRKQLFRLNWFWSQSASKPVEEQC